MNLIKKANFYVERYSVSEGELILDFIFENEFIFFRNRGDYTNTMQLYQYEPSMILVHNIKLDIPVHEGDIISVDMERVFELQFRYLYEESETNVIGFEISDSNHFFKQIIESDSTHIIKYISKNNYYSIKETWKDGKPCALENLSNNIHITTADIGQGNFNLIMDDNKNLTCFDFGVSLYFSKRKFKQICENFDSLFDNADKITLIISHWDSDHYNLLNAVKDEFLQRICCVFVPRNLITLTAKQIAKRLESLCPNITAIDCPVRKSKGVVGIHPYCEGKHYTLYAGETSMNINKSGLALSVFGDKDALILSADHTNNQIWSCIYTDISRKLDRGKIHIIIPHHGGYCGKILAPSFDLKPGIAVISVGKNPHKHPVQSVIDDYLRMGFLIKRTDWERDNIVIDLA